MKLQEIIKYNGAIFLTGLFFTFISATSCGSILLHRDPAAGMFITAFGMMLFGGALAMYAVKGYQAEAAFVPDYFIISLPVTGLLILLCSALDSGELLILYAFIWGFSSGACFELLLRSNPDPQATGYPAFALGSVGGGVLSMSATSGYFHLYDIFAILSVIIALMPVICFAGRLKTIRRLTLSFLLGCSVCLITVSQAVKFRDIDSSLTMLDSTKPLTPRTDTLEEMDITSLLPPLLQNNSPRMRVLISEPNASGLGQKISKLPFIEEVIRTSNSTVILQPASIHSNLRRLMTEVSYNQYTSTAVKNPDFDVIIIITEKPLSEHDNRFYTKEFYQLTAGFLQDDGILITSAANPAQAAAISSTIKQIFPHFLLFPARSQDEIFVVASHKPLISDYNELDRRALQRFEHMGFCRGMLSMLLPPAQFNGLQKKIPTSTIAHKINSDIYPLYLDRLSAKIPADIWKYLPWSLLALYLFWRFIMARKQERRMAFNLFENGFYCGGFVMINMFLCQAIEGQLYLYLGWMLAIFIVGTACGFNLHSAGGMLRRSVTLCSIAVPFTLLWYNHIIYQEYYLPIICANMFAAGLFGGSAIAISSAGMERSVYREYVSWLITGLPVGIAACWFMLTTGQSLLGCIILMIVSRIPLLLVPVKMRTIPAKSALL